MDIILNTSSPVAVASTSIALNDPYVIDLSKPSELPYVPMTRFAPTSVYVFANDERYADVPIISPNASLQDYAPYITELSYRAIIAALTKQKFVTEVFNEIFPVGARLRGGSKRVTAVSVHEVVTTKLKSLGSFDGITAAIVTCVLNAYLEKFGVLIEGVHIHGVATRPNRSTRVTINTLQDEIVRSRFKRASVAMQERMNRFTISEKDDVYLQAHLFQISQDIAAYVVELELALNAVNVLHDILVLVRTYLLEEHSALGIDYAPLAESAVVRTLAANLTIAHAALEESNPTFTFPAVVLESRAAELATMLRDLPNIKEVSVEVAAKRIMISDVGPFGRRVGRSLFGDVNITDLQPVLRYSDTVFKDVVRLVDFSQQRHVLSAAGVTADAVKRAFAMGGAADKLSSAYVENCYRLTVVDPVSSEGFVLPSYESVEFKDLTPEEVLEEQRALYRNELRNDAILLAASQRALQCVLNTSGAPTFVYALTTAKLRNGLRAPAVFGQFGVYEDLFVAFLVADEQTGEAISWSDYRLPLEVFKYPQYSRMLPSTSSLQAGFATTVSYQGVRHKVVIPLMTAAVEQTYLDRIRLVATRRISRELKNAASQITAVLGKANNGEEFERVAAEAALMQLLDPMLDVVRNTRTASSILAQCAAAVVANGVEANERAATLGLLEDRNALIDVLSAILVTALSHYAEEDAVIAFVNAVRDCFSHRTFAAAILHEISSILTPIARV